MTLAEIFLKDNKDLEPIEQLLDLDRGLNRHCVQVIYMPEGEYTLVQFSDTSAIKFYLSGQAEAF